jgi:hypothetical protein
MPASIDPKDPNPFGVKVVPIDDGPNRGPIVLPCAYCPGDDASFTCPYCNGAKELTWDWYYGLEQKVCSLNEEVRGHTGNGDWIDLKKGSLVKVVMCSRFGDVGITPDLKTDRGYIVRVDPEILTEEPDAEAG